MSILVSSTQTPPKVSILTKILTYFQIAAAIGMEIPETHVAAISTLIETLATDLKNGLPQTKPAAPSTAPPGNIAVVSKFGS